MIKKIFKIFLKIFLVLISAYVLFVIIVMLIMYWPILFPDRDRLSRNIVKQCNSDFNDCIVSADQVTDFNWDNVYIFKEAVGDELISKILGFKYMSPNDGIRRKIIFTLNNEIVHSETNFYDSFESPPNHSTFFKYDGGEPFCYISRDKKNAIFKITSLNVSENKTYYNLTPLKQ